MKRFFIYLGVLLVLMACTQLKAHAVQEQDIYERSGAEELGAEKDINFLDKVWEIFTDAYEGAIGGAFKYCGIILGCLILLSLAENLRALREDKGSGAAMDFVSAVALSAACFPALSMSFEYAKAAVEGLCGFSVSLMPVMGALYSMGGNTAQGVAAVSGFSVFLTVTEVVCAKLLLPVLSVGFAFSLTGLLPGAASLAPLSSFVKNLSCTLIAFTFSLVCFGFYTQTAVTAAADNFAYRSIKFASGSFVPLIGNAVGDSARTVFGAVSVVKSSVGAWGLAVMLAYLLPPVISGFLYKLAFSFCSVSAKLFGLEKAAKFLGELSSLLGISLALLIAAAIVFTVISAVFLKSGVSA
ncbi:MAG: hypothetical protein IJN86_03610 [Clostridia bacterium]|nr:hypothetical protein [Clostridia bacterium]